MTPLLAMAWRNLWRHRWRSLLTALAMGMGVGLCMATITLYEGMFATLREIMIDRQVGHVQVHHEDYVGRRGMYDAIPNADAVVDSLDALPTSTGVVSRLYGNALLGTEARSNGVQLVGVLPDREAAATHLDAVMPTALRGGRDPGRFLAPEAAREVVLGWELAEDLEVDVGDEVVAVTQDAMGGIGNEAYTIVGLFRSGDTLMDRSGVYLHQDDLQELLALDDQVHEIRVLTTSDARATVTTLETDIEAALAKLSPEDTPLSVRPWWTVQPLAAQMLDMQTISQVIIMGIVFFLAGLGVINTMLMSVLERTREIGVIRALGMKPATVVLVITLEAAFLAILAGALGLVIGGALDAWLVYGGVDFSVGDDEGFTAGGFTLPPVLYGKVTVASVLQPLLGAMLFAVIAAIWPAVRAARLRPVDAIRN